MSDLAPVASWLQATGPYGLVVVLGWAIWKINEKKDAALRELYEEVTKLSRTQIEAIAKVEAALLALRDAIANLRPEARGGRHTRPEI
jgi:outer membrane protein TolC